MSLPRTKQAQAKNHVTVRAAAGTGKTWLLTSRIITLLLQGVSPGSILAITFTRKAASEIYQRVKERLRWMMTADEDDLLSALAELETLPAPVTLRRARGLFEALLTADAELRTTTFHAFCQEILYRFPLEAEGPLGFDLLESPTALQHAAWRAFDRELMAAPTGALANAMETLFQSCGGTVGAHQVLEQFLAHRSDWWAYTEHEWDPVADAERRLAASLRPPAVNQVNAWRNDPALVADLRRYTELLSQSPNATHREHAHWLEVALDSRSSVDEAFELLSRALLTRNLRPRRLTPSQRMLLVLGRDRADKLIHLHAQLAERIQNSHQDRLRHRTFETNCAWYRCGQRLLDHYQRLKAEQRLLDFDDLEWRTYQLLNRSHHAEWIQYKLDQRIDHLLVDEFQDTNPTQWRLLLPLLREMAAGSPQRYRSVLLVGDEKQSIYRFRRADPQLFNAAQAWLEQHMQAQTRTQDRSYRSSPAIVQFVNLLFGETASTEEFELPDYRAHDTYHQNRWGRVELLPLIPRGSSLDVHGSRTAWRNPLQQPRRLDEDQRYRAEGELIAARIKTLIGKSIDDNGVRPLGFDDIMILLRDRTHAASYEAALRHASIPYIGIGRGTLTQSLEIQDLIHLLRSLVASHDNVALASALCSPVFDCKEDDLMRLAQSERGQTWRERLAAVAEASPEDSPLVRAARLVERWAGFVDRMPVHDLLDRMYKEGNVLARYAHAVPPHLKNRVQANLRSLLELALDLDSGRYPSLSRFLEHLPMLADENPQVRADTLIDPTGLVRIMTIHAAKGLESPIVFLADAMRDYRSRGRGMRTMVDWPVESARPRHFQLIGKKAHQDSASTRLLVSQNKALRDEESSLLYVALTRAKHALFISGCESLRGRHTSWYEFIDTRIRQVAARKKTPIPGLKLHGRTFGSGIVLEHGTPPATIKSRTVARHEQIAIDPRLTQPLSESEADGFLYPSFASADADCDGDTGAVGLAGSAKTRGTLIHRMLELLTRGHERTEIRTRIVNELHEVASRELIQACWQEACAVVDDPELRPLFDPSHYYEARNEVPILYRDHDIDVYGVIDRLIVRNHEIVVVDYKTHAHATPTNVVELGQRFNEQMRLYTNGVRKQWPTLPVRPVLLFTVPRAVVELTEGVSREP
ncbi:MAG: UvrD-helicase domain-containing protein [Acidiferrobacterales bacterium]